MPVPVYLSHVGEAGSVRVHGRRSFSRPPSGPSLTMRETDHAVPLDIGMGADLRHGRDQARSCGVEVATAVLQVVPAPTLATVALRELLADLKE